MPGSDLSEVAKLQKAVFLDRDGVLNRNVFYQDSQAWESPRSAPEFCLQDGVVPALAALQRAGFLLFLVSNQPNVVNGKSSRMELQHMQDTLDRDLAAGGVELRDAFYCTHHPAFTGACHCRKPSPFFLMQAAQEHGLLLSACWMVGDRVTDMQCGRAAGVRTAWVRTGQERLEPDSMLRDLLCASLEDAASQILTAAE